MALALGAMMSASSRPASDRAFYLANAAISLVAVGLLGWIIHEFDAASGCGQSGAVFSGCFGRAHTTRRRTLCSE
jgi:hypothetical protein